MTMNDAMNSSNGFNFSAVEIALVNGSLSDALRVAIMISDAQVEASEKTTSDSSACTIAPSRK